MERVAEDFTQQSSLSVRIRRLVGSIPGRTGDTLRCFGDVVFFLLGNRGGVLGRPGRPQRRVRGGPVRTLVAPVVDLDGGLRRSLAEQLSVLEVPNPVSKAFGLLHSLLAVVVF